jgi:hypothetical protein
VFDMAHRRQPRSTQTKDLSATLRSAGHTRVIGRVLNLSEGGMLFAGSDLDVGETTSFELEGPGFRFADPRAPRPVAALIATPRTAERVPAARRRRALKLLVS